MKEESDRLELEFRIIQYIVVVGFIYKDLKITKIEIFLGFLEHSGPFFDSIGVELENNVDDIFGELGRDFSLGGELFLDSWILISLQVVALQSIIEHKIVRYEVEGIFRAIELIDDRSYRVGYGEFGI